MLVHICCSVDSHYFLKRLRESLPHEKIIGFFYNPNIHPHEEYELRLLDVQRSCKKYGIELIEGEYDLEGWLQAAKGLECEKERGKRCEVCFEIRLEVTAKKAKEIGENSITTTLFMSPKKSFEQLSFVAEEISRAQEIEVLCFDFRKGGGTQAQFELARADRLYRQNYCGCIYALKDQREAQKRLAGELLSPIGREILNGSITERMELYKKAQWCEENNREFKIEKKRFKHYRLLWGMVTQNSKSIQSYFVGEYEFEDEPLEAEITEIKDGFGFTRNYTLFLSLESFNKIAKKSYKSVKELIYNPITPQEHLDISYKLIDYSPIIVLEKIEKTTYKIEAKSVFYEDVMEVLAIL